jgi:DNA helicase HerA-like ATPase
LPAGLNIHEGTLSNLRRGLETVRRLPFLESHAPDNPVKRILEYLDRGINVVLEFGRYSDVTAYILVANLLTRRLHAQYRERMEKALGEGIAPPCPLVITIEEAHKFLNPEVASQTIFGTIAREMRKYNVTLLVIDQRPSGIDDEVMSQIGTKITCLLDNERDIDSVLAGVSGKSELKSVLSRLESRQQALIFGHAVPMPVVVRTREYGSVDSYKDFMPAGEAEIGKQAEKDIEELWE